MNTMQVICLIFIVLISMIIGRRTKRLKYPIIGEISMTEKKFKFYVDDLQKLDNIVGSSEYVVLRVKSRLNQPY